MRKLFKGQRILSVLYILASIGMFLFALAFMTEYSDLFSGAVLIDRSDNV